MCKNPTVPSKNTGLLHGKPCMSGYQARNNPDTPAFPHNTVQACKARTSRQKNRIRIISNGHYEMVGNDSRRQDGQSLPTTSPCKEKQAFPKRKDPLYENKLLEQKGKPKNRIPRNAPSVGSTGSPRRRISLYRPDRKRRAESPKPRRCGCRSKPALPRNSDRSPPSP